jgi:hypothetical protein
MDQVVQQNASLVEEASTAAENLSGEAEEMSQLIATFKVEEKTFQSRKLFNHAKSPVRSESPDNGNSHPTEIAQRNQVHPNIVEDFFEGENRQDVF